jgi:Zn-dependent peptidase ImmA (M78 family)
LGADKDSAARSRFDAAHELGHHVLHAAVKPKRLMNALERKAVEREAHQFASAFLLPASEFARDLRAPTLDGMRIAKSRWAVSIGAMIQRCVDLEILRSHEAERLWIARAKRGWVRQEPLDDELPMEQPTLLRKAIELVVLEGEGTRAQILRDLPLGAADIEALGGLPAGYFAEEGAPVRLLARRPNSGQDQGETGQIIEFPGDD